MSASRGMPLGLRLRRTLARERVAVAVAFFATGATFGTWAARIPAVQQRVGLSAFQLGIGFAGWMVGAFAAMPLAGAVVARFGSRRLLASSVLLFVPVLALLPLAPSLPLLTALLLAFGAANSGVDVAINTQGTHVERRFGKAVMSGFHAVFSVGALTAAGVAAVLAARNVSTVTHFAAVAAILAPMALASIIWLTDEPREGEQAPTLALPTRALAVPAVIAFAMVFAEDILNTWSAVYLRTAAHTSAGAAATGFAVYSAGMLAGRLVADRLVRRHGAAVTLHIGGVASTIGAALTLAVPHPLSIDAGLFLLGLGLAPVLPVVFSVVAHRDATRAGTSIAAVTTVGYLGSVVGPPLVGQLAEPFTLRVALLAVPLATLTTALLPYRMQPRDEAEQ